MIKKFLYTVIVLLFPVLIFAQNTRYAASFLELGVSTRALGMGSAYVGLSNDASGAFWNPAGLAYIPKFQASSMYANLFNSLETQSFVSAATPLFGGATISLSWIRLSVDDIPRYIFEESSNINAFQRITLKAQPLTAEPDGYFGSYDDAYYITFAKHVPLNLDLGWQYWEMPIEMGFGLNLKMIKQSLDNKTGSGVGVDLGYLLKLKLNDIFVDPYYGDLLFGLNVQDIANTQITWDTDSKHKDRIQRNFKYGFAYAQPLDFINSRLTFAYDINSRYNGSGHLGAEFLYHSLLAIRVGSNAGFFTTGAGLYIWKLHFDYAFQSHDLGNSHRVGVLFSL
jgi:hypothetical protein